MIYLLLSIVTASALNILFKIFGKRKLDLFKVIMVNYVVCFLTGQWFSPSPVGWAEMTHATWFTYAAILGVVFIVGFNIIAQTVHYFGITVATVMQKMSLLLSVLFAILAFGEPVGIIKVTGLILALGSILLITYKEKAAALLHDKANVTHHWYLPALTFLLSGFIDSTLLYVNKTGIVLPADDHFITGLFGVAAISAIAYYLYLRLLGRTSGMQMGELVGGTILGVVNYFSIFFIMRLLQTGWDGSVIFPMNNIGVLVLSAVTGIVLFREHMNRQNRLGLILALAALIILGLAT